MRPPTDAMTLTAAQPEADMLVAFGAAGQLLAALRFSEGVTSAGRQPHVVVDRSIPKPGAVGWPDAPVTLHRTGCGQQRVGTPGRAAWLTVEQTDDVAVALRAGHHDS